MKNETRFFTTELAIIGSGLAGFAASIFALGKNISTAQTGNTGAIAYTTGYFDLLGKQGDQILQTPWNSIKDLKNSDPTHPLAAIPVEDINASFQEFTSYVDKLGLSYTAPGDSNLQMLTPAGTIKPTFCVPTTMVAGAAALEEKKKCLIIDIKGLRGFSGKQIVANQKDNWPDLRCTTLTFPGCEHGEIYPEVMARSLEVPLTLQLFADQIKEIMEDAEVIGLPAILGMHAPDTVASNLEKMVGVPIFEIPTMPPSVPGIRLREMFEQAMPQQGLTLVAQQKVDEIEFTKDAVILKLTDNFGPIEIKAQAAILATGRFLSGGLEAHIDTVIEPLVGLKVHQPASRADWYNNEYMGHEGHEIHRSGIEVDEDFRPLTEQGVPLDPRLFAAGSILAHQDWIRSRSGAGIAIPTAFKAVEAAERIITASK